MKKFAQSLMPRFNLDGGAAGGGGGGEPAVAPEGATSNSGVPNQTAQPGMVNPLLADVSGQPSAAADFVDFAGRKVPVVDPVIRDIHRDYTELNRTFQSTNQQFKQTQEQNQQLMQMVNMFQQMQQQQPQQQQPAAQQTTPEDLEAFKEEFMNTFYDDPRKAIQGLVDQLVQPALQPVQELQKERQFSQQVQSVQAKYADFQDMVPQMQEILSENPRLEELGLETVYLAAKGKAAHSQPQLSPEQMLNDPNFRQQIMSNPEISQQIVSQYLSNKQNIQTQTPPVMGSSTGGQMLAAPEQKPETLRAGSKAFLQWLGMSGQQ